jgi:hypothetical protein
MLQDVKIILQHPSCIDRRRRFLMDIRRFFAILAMLILTTGMVAAQEDDPFADSDPGAGDAADPFADPFAEDGADGAEEDPAAALGLPQTDENAEELKRFDYEIEVAALRAYNEHFGPAKFINDNWPDKEYNLHPPRLPEDQVEAKVEAEVSRIVELKYPESRLDEIKDEAEVKFKMYKIGTIVTLEFTHQEKTRMLVDRLEAITNEHVKVGLTTIYKEDVIKEYLPKLYRVEHEEAVRKYIRNENRKFTQAKTAYTNKVRAVIAKRYWSRYNYFSSGEQRIARSKAIGDKYEAKRKEMMEQLRTEKTEEIRQSKGWTFDTAMARWVPPAPEIIEEAVQTDSLDQLKDQLKGLLPPPDPGAAGTTTPATPAPDAGEPAAAPAADGDKPATAGDAAKPKKTAAGDDDFWD